MDISSTISEHITTQKKTSGFTGSIFTLTINTNKSLNTKNEAVIERLPEIKQCFEDLAANLFAERNLPKIIEIFQFSTSTLQTAGKAKEKVIMPFDQDKIKDIKAETVIEANTDGLGFLHLHSVITVIHKEKVQINLKLVKAVVYRKLEKCLTFDGKYKKPYVSVRGRKTAYAIENYLK
jgi:hypothetical protein